LWFFRNILETNIKGVIVSIGKHKKSLEHLELIIIIMRVTRKKKKFSDLADGEMTTQLWVSHCLEDVIN